MKNVLSKVSLDVHKEKILLALIIPHRVIQAPREAAHCQIAKKGEPLEVMVALIKAG